MPAEDVSSFLRRQRVDAAELRAIRDEAAPPANDNSAVGRGRSRANGDPKAVRNGAASPPVRKAQIPIDVLAAWRAEGPLVHEPTGLADLDAATGGGPIYGSRWYLIGAPDSGKTALAVQIGDEYAARGVVVGLLAVDEEPGDILMRFAQRRGVTRHACEVRSEETLAAIAAGLDGLRIHFYDSTWTIESAISDLAALAAGERAAMIVDSIQTVECDTERGPEPPRSLREAVNARVVAVRACATRHRIFVLATSEMNRNAYRSIEAAEQANDLASAKESGAVEYSARVALALRNVPGESDLLELRIAKNKHGPKDGRLGLHLDRASMTLACAQLPAQVDANEAGAAKGRAQANTDAAVLALVLAAAPGSSGRSLYPVVRVRAGTMSRDRFETAKAVLAAAGALVVVQGPRKAEYHYIDGARVPDVVLEAVPLEERPHLVAAQPPEASHA